MELRYDLPEIHSPWQIIRDEYITLLKRKEERLEKVGFKDLYLRGSHVLLSLDHKGKLVKDDESIPEMRICNFELLKKYINN